jgi:Predicted xylanase/chitin deacetylase
MLWVINGKKFKKSSSHHDRSFLCGFDPVCSKTAGGRFHPDKRERRFVQGRNRTKASFSTFDCNWGDQQIKTILETLKKEHVRATFFLSGEWAERHPDLVQQAAKDGNEIESQGMRHEDYTQLSPGEVRRDIILANAAIDKSGGGKPQLLRPPYGK